MLSSSALTVLCVLLGCAVVFALLGAVAVIVLCFRVSSLENEVRALSANRTPLPAMYDPDITIVPVVPSAPIAPAPVYDPNSTVGEMSVFDVPDRTAAKLMAIVADEMKTPLAQLKFISIKEVK